MIFLAEAFTRRAVMRELAKLGFTPVLHVLHVEERALGARRSTSTELAHTDEAEYFRPNFFANTPDILHEYLQHGGPAAFHVRLLLAAHAQPDYGLYSGYEHYENVPVREGSEEYLDSEKYELKERALDGPLLPLVQRLNTIRRENPALQQLTNLAFLETENEALIAYVKRAEAQHAARRRQPRSPPRPGGRRDRARRARPAAGLRGRGPAHRRALRLAHRAATTCAWTPSYRARRTSCRLEAPSL